MKLTARVSGKASCKRGRVALSSFRSLPCSLEATLRFLGVFMGTGVPKAYQIFLCVIISPLQREAVAYEGPVTLLLRFGISKRKNCCFNRSLSDSRV